MHKNLMKMFLCLELWFLLVLIPMKLIQLTKNESFDEYKLQTVMIQLHLQNVDSGIKSPNLLSVLT